MTLSEIKKYRKKDVYSYCLGSFPTLELLQTRPEMAEMILLHSCIVIGVFRKYHCRLEHDANHVVLVNPGDMGNLGTIIRSCVGFGITNLALIEPAADIFHPRAVRASMGAIFKMKFEYFPCFDQYNQEYGGERELYPFMLSGEHQLGTFEHSKNKPYSLIFGNEASGLDAGYMNVSKSVVIPQTHSVDSLNLSLAADNK